MSVPDSDVTGFVPEDFYRDGMGFLRRARAFGKRFADGSPDLVFNLASMALEKLLMAFAVSVNRLPGNHTFRDFSEALSGVEGFPSELGTSILKHDAVFNLCSLAPATSHVPTKEEIAGLLADAEAAAQAAGRRLGVAEGQS